MTLKGKRPSFCQLGISLERKLGIQNPKKCIEDIRVDHGGRFYVQIRAEQFKNFKTTLDRSLDCDNAEWNLELEDDIGIFEVDNTYLSPSKDKTPIVIGNVDTDIEAEAAIAAIARSERLPLEPLRH